ncbi:hypothetical protein A8709_28840 [Paenibacillus pectinilyticus]|uniref:Major facilitator superfamily (MFS) profile domain-containing protein n=1 Tax=Paenibacillus pectinilyticus TaxID=512399 RepID=A0A1C0ZUU8_9BACL|nr:MFS transporter [Paenibacillus pectinilyticus]OCT11874.1 hypothetical protein A8709_28840 [Paenibacillus pectinilyticus]
MAAVLTKWFGPHPDVRLLQMVTFVRSMGQGLALVDISLYLKDLGWSGSAIGAVLAGAGLVRIMMTLFITELNALFGAKRFLLVFEVLVALGALVAAFFSYSLALDFALIVAGVGSSHSGSGGPTYPIERRWLAAYDRKRTGTYFHTNAVVGYMGLGIGCLLACLPTLWSSVLPGANGYRPIFLLLTLLSGVCIYLILRLKGGERKPPSPESQAEATALKRSDILTFLWIVIGLAALFALLTVLHQLGLQEAALYVPIIAFLLILLVPNLRLLKKKNSEEEEVHAITEMKNMANILSGVTTTLTSTMTSYWFAVKFAASPGWIGVVMGMSYIAAGVWSLLAPIHLNKFGTVRAIILTQLLAVLCLLALPWTTSFWIAALLEIGCTACNLGTRGNRTAILMEDRPSGKRSLFAKMNYMLIRIGAVLWPGAFGKFIDVGRFVTPFYIVGAIQLSSMALFAKVHKEKK